MTALLPDLLRRAAAEMRRRAEAATPGPWPVVGREEGDEWRGLAAGPISSRTHILAATTVDAEHIASWHPTIAILVADLLDEIAGEYEAWSWPLAEYLARAYLDSAAEPLAPAREAAEPVPAPVSTVEEAG